MIKSSKIPVIMDLVWGRGQQQQQNTSFQAVNVKTNEAGRRIKSDKDVGARHCRQDRRSLEGDIWVKAGVHRGRELSKDSGEEHQGGGKILGQETG